MNSQWRPLQPDVGPSNNGSLSPLQSQFGRGPRQITKNPQNMGGLGGHNGFGGYNNYGNLSNMPTSQSATRLSSLLGSSSGFDFGLDGLESGHRVNNGDLFSDGSSRNNGFMSSMNSSSSNNGGGNSLFSSGFENLRSPMGGGHHGSSGNSGFERQMSVPANLSDHGSSKMNNGFGQSNNHGGGWPGDSPGNFYGHRNSGNSAYVGMPPQKIRPESPPPAMGARPGFNDMKIGTWNEGGGSGGSGNNMGGASNGSGNNMGGGMSNGGNNFPSMGNFEIGTFNISSAGNNSSQSRNGYNNDHPHPGPGHRETGIIEKLLVILKNVNNVFFKFFRSFVHNFTP